MNPCPHCGHPKTHKHGDRRRKCAACGKTFTIDPQRAGRKPLGDKPMTPYERLKKHLKKHK